MGIFRIAKRLSLLALALGGLPNLQAHDKGHGLRVAPPEVIAHVEDNWPVIVGVKPNHVGLQRIQEHRAQHGLPPLFASPAQPHEEFVVVKGKANAAKHAFEAGEAASSLPSSVDNSQLPSFPPIGDQQQLGSCVGWGTTYYQGTHEYGLLNGLNNKNSFSNVFSPKWTYNQLNGGQDGGLDIFSTYDLFTQNGHVSIESYPYDADYLAWDTNVSDWITGISTRSAPGQLVAGIGGDNQNLNVIKQLLNNGHVLVFGTFIESWQNGQVGTDPNAADNSHAGELCALWCNGQQGGHCMTIVGYDDNIWCDVNGNGQVDSGEYGAFKIANSWNTSWGNDGFVWIAYDAFLSQSAVPNGPSNGRVPIGDAMNSNVVSVVPKAKNYAPKLIAQFSLSQALRDQISISAGVSDTNSTSPTTVFNSCSLTNKGGDFEFDGTTGSSPQTATFALDLTDLIPSDPTQTARYYLMVSDNTAGNPTVLNSFTLIDTVNNRKVACTSTPQTCDNSQVSSYIDYSIANGPPAPPKPVPPKPVPPKPVPPKPVPPKPVPPPAPSTPPSVSIVSPSNYQFVSGTFTVNANATDAAGIGHVDFYIDGQAVSTATQAPYGILVDSSALWTGLHNVTAIAYNINGQQTTSKTVQVFVFNLW